LIVPRLGDEDIARAPAAAALAGIGIEERVVAACPPRPPML
jgi:hypothetical protein